jgi:hypothetical protein
MTTPATPCYRCVRYQGSMRCHAFGEVEIPLEILEGKNDHTKPVDGDHGLLFEEGLPEYAREEDDGEEAAEG